MIPGVVAGGMRIGGASVRPQNLRFLTTESKPSSTLLDGGRSWSSGPSAGLSFWWKSKGNVARSASAGNWYYEVLIDERVFTSRLGLAIGVAVAGTDTSMSGNAGVDGRHQYFADGQRRSGGFFEPYGQPYGVGDRIGVSIQLVNGRGNVRFYKNGVDQGLAFSQIQLGTSSLEPHFCHQPKASTDFCKLSLPPSVLYLPPGFSVWN